MALYEDIGNAPGQVYDFLKRKYVSLTTPDEEGDYSSRKGRISRNEKLAEVLSQMGAQEQAVSTAGGITAPVSGMGALARGLTSFGGSYLSGKAAKDAEALDKASRAEAAAAGKALYTKPGTKGQLRISDEDPGTTAAQMEMNMPTLPGQGPSSEKVQYTLNMPNIPGREMGGGARPYEDRQRMLDEFAMSDNPYLVRLSERIAAKEKPEFVPGDKEGIFQLVDGKLVNVVEPRPDATDVPAASTLYKLQRERASLIAGGAKNDDPLVRQYDAAINLETTRAPGVSISMGDNTNRVLQGLDAADLGDYRTKRSAAQTMLSTVQDLKTIDPAKLYTGSLADLKTKFSSYANAAGLGGIDLTKLANSETYQAQLANVGIKLVKGLGANPTDTDLKFIMSSLPLLTKQPAARAELLKILEQRAMEDIKNYADASSYYKKNNSLIGFVPTGSRTASGIPTRGFNPPPGAQ